MGNKVVSSSTDTFIRRTSISSHFRRIRRCDSQTRPVIPVWDMETGECERRVAANQDTIWCSQFLDQNTVITGGADIRVLSRRSLPS